jgi:tRNA pseudouridine55 synthase
MIRDLSFDLLDELNKINIDKYGRVSAFLAINKPIGITSHDVVDQVRKKLGTRQVGHVGALDPDAEGVMLILVGKKYTRLSDNLMTLDKSYRMVIGFGFATDSLDLDGRILEVKIPKDFDFENVIKDINSFDGGYEQYVPIYSSVKVHGDKLRVLARKYRDFQLEQREDERYVVFSDPNLGSLELKVPQKPVNIFDIKIEKTGFTKVEKFGEELNDENIPFVEVELSCSKGTYVRQLASDVGAKSNIPSTLLYLQRTRIGSVTLDKCINIEEVEYNRD